MSGHEQSQDTQPQSFNESLFDQQRLDIVLEVIANHTNIDNQYQQSLARAIVNQFWDQLITFGDLKSFLTKHERLVKDTFQASLSKLIQSMFYDSSNISTDQKRQASNRAGNILIRLWGKICQQTTDYNQAQSRAGTGMFQGGSSARGPDGQRVSHKRINWKGFGTRKKN